MTRSTSPRPAPRIPVTAVLGIVAMLASLTWVFNTNLIVSRMGRSTVRAAGSLLEGRGLEDRPGQPFAQRAPLHPLLLGGLGAIGLRPSSALRVVSCLGFVATLLGLTALCDVLRLRWKWGLIALAGVFAPSYLLLRMNFAESILIGATLFAVAWLARHLGTGHRRSLVAAAVACSIAMLSHYLAVLVLLPVTVLALLLSNPPSEMRARTAKLLLFLPLACGPIAIWLGRNVVRTGHLSGMSRVAERGDLTEHSLVYHFLGLLETAGTDLFGYLTLGSPDVVYDGLPAGRPIVSLAAMLIATVCLGGAILLGREQIGAHIADQWRRRSPAAYGWVLTAAYSVWHLIVLLLVWTFTNNDRIQTRYLAPVYPFLLVLLFVIPTAVTKTGRSTWCKGALFVCILLFVGLQGIKTLAVMEDEPSPTVVREVWVRGSDAFLERWTGWRSTE